MGYRVDGCDCCGDADCCGCGTSAAWEFTLAGVTDGSCTECDAVNDTWLIDAPGPGGQAFCRYVTSEEGDIAGGLCGFGFFAPFIDLQEAQPGEECELQLWLEFVDDLETRSGTVLIGMYNGFFTTGQCPDQITLTRQDTGDDDCDTMPDTITLSKVA